MAGTANLKEDAVLALHLDFFVVEPPRRVHRAKDLQHLFATEPWLFLRLGLRSTATTHWFDCGGHL